MALFVKTEYQPNQKVVQTLISSSGRAVFLEAQCIYTYIIIFSLNCYNLTFLETACAVELDTSLV